MNDTTVGQSVQTMQLDIPQFAGKSFHIIRMEGEESISRPYAFNVHFTCPDILDGASVIGKSVTLTLLVGSETLVATGVVVEFRSDDPTPLGDYAYHLRIGPRFSLLEWSKQNQVYGTVTPIKIDELITGKLSNSLSAKSTSGGEKVEIDYELRLSGAYPARANVVQFDESDLNFIARSCEHAGVFYFFEHSSQKDTIVFGDANVAFKSSAITQAGNRGTYSDSLPFRMTRGNADDLAVSSFVATSRPVPQKIYLRDFDDMQAGTQLLASSLVDQQGIGAVVEYGQNFTSIEEGDRLATVRAEEMNSHKTIFNGVSSAPQLRPGYFFTLEGHPSMSGKYVVIAARHRAGQPLMADGPYENRFECIKFDTPYRPQRVTPRPVAAGVFNATIDSSGLGERADIDDVGRYKVRQVFDESNSPPGHASKFVREAQPYAGKDDTGFHFPLLKDTEVVVGYVNGDPDRPIILGAVPNSLTPAVSILDNNAINRFRTPSGALFEINDGGGMVSDPPFVRVISESAGMTEFKDSSYLRLGSYIKSEADLQTSGVTVTSSTVTYETFDSSQDYLTNSLDSSASKGQLTTAQLQGNTATANLSKAKVNPTNRTPLNKGLLMYTDGDLQLNTKGAAYMQFQSGHSTVVSAGDATYNVSNGTFTVAALNGVSITAGMVPNAKETLAGSNSTLTTLGTEFQTAAAAEAAAGDSGQAAVFNTIANDLLNAGVGNTAAGAATGSAGANYSGSGSDPAAGGDAATQAGIAAGTQTSHSAAPADLYLWASNNINQKAYGPMSEVTYGDSYKNVQGNTTDIFSGTYYKETHGILIQHLYADTTNYNHQNTTTTTYGNTTSTVFGTTNSLFTGAVLSTKIDAELNIVVGIKTDLIMGLSIKIVPVLDLSILGVGMKLAIADTKFAALDYKNVLVDAKTFVTEWKNGAVVSDNNYVGKVKMGATTATLGIMLGKVLESSAKLTALYAVI